MGLAVIDKGGIGKSQRRHKGSEQGGGTAFVDAPDSAAVRAVFGEGKAAEG